MYAPGPSKWPDLRGWLLTKALNALKVDGPTRPPPSHREDVAPEFEFRGPKGHKSHVLAYDDEEWVPGEAVRSLATRLHIDPLDVYCVAANLGGLTDEELAAIESKQRRS